MALRSQAATLLRLRGRPAVTQSLWVRLTRRSISTTQFPSDEVREGLYYADSHECVEVDGDIGTIGIKDHARTELGDLVLLELPEAGKSLTHADKLGSVESVKTVSDIISPEVIETNSLLIDVPGIINLSPYDDGWLVRVKMSDSFDLKKLMNHEQYSDHLSKDATLKTPELHTLPTLLHSGPHNSHRLEHLLKKMLENATDISGGAPFYSQTWISVTSISVKTLYVLWGFLLPLKLRLVSVMW